MIGTPFANRCAVLALLFATAALAFDLGRDTCPNPDPFAAPSQIAVFTG